MYYSLSFVVAPLVSIFPEKTFAWLVVEVCKFVVAVVYNKNCRLAVVIADNEGCVVDFCWFVVVVTGNSDCVVLLVVEPKLEEKALCKLEMKINSVANSNELIFPLV